MRFEHFLVQISNDLEKWPNQSVSQMLRISFILRLWMSERRLWMSERRLKNSLLM